MERVREEAAGKQWSRNGRSLLVLERIKKNEVVSEQGLKIRGYFSAQCFRKQIEQWEIKGKKNYFILEVNVS